MRRKFYLTAVLIVSVLSSFAQQPFKRELAVGGSFGASLSKISFYPKVFTNQMLTFDIGGTVRWVTDKNVGIQAELNYAQRGWEEQFDDPEYYYRRRINYIELPFMTHIYIGNRRIRAIINVGPQIGYAFSENTEENISGLNSNPPPNQTTKQRDLKVQQPFEWGICGGGGLEIRTGIGHFILEGRYFFGLGDILSTRQKDDFGKASPQVITVKLSYLLPILNK